MLRQFDINVTYKRTKIFQQKLRITLHRTDKIKGRFKKKRPQLSVRKPTLGVTNIHALLILRLLEDALFARRHCDSLKLY